MFRALIPGDFCINYIINSLLTTHFITAISNIAALARNQVKINTCNALARNFSQFSLKPVNIQFPAINTVCNTQILAQKSLIQPCQSTIVRNLTKFSLRKAKRKSVKAVVSIKLENTAHYLMDWIFSD